MTTNDIFSYFAGERLKQWMTYYLKKPAGVRNKLFLHIILGCQPGKNRSDEIVMPISFKSSVEFTYLPIYTVSLN